MRDRKPMKSRKSPSEPRRRDNRGYTLQTIIVMSILIAAAVGASVVLFRAVNTNTDVRSLTDLAGSNAPSRPHGFSVEKTLVSVGSPSRDVPSATIRWSPPLYTGQTQLEGTPASVLYKVDYGCADPDDVPAISELADITLENIPDLNSNNPTDTVSTMDRDESKLDPDGAQTHYGDSTELSIPGRIPEDLFPSSGPPDTVSPFDTVYCILQAQAYTCSDAQTEDCANPGDNAFRTDNALTGREIYSLESEPIRFELSKAPAEILNLEYVVPPEGMTATNNRVDLAWDTPEYTGTDEAFLYEIQWKQREESENEADFDDASFTPDGTPQCTVGNAHSLDLKLDADDPPDSVNDLIVDIRITPISATQAIADAAVPPSFTCPPTDDIHRNPLDLFGITLVENGSVAANLPTISSIAVPPSGETVPTDPDEKRIYLQNSFVNLQATAGIAVPRSRSYNLESYELRWSRADGTSFPNSKVIPAPDPVAHPTETTQEIYRSTVTLNLENDKAYNFDLIANFNNGETRSASRCAVVSHSQRTSAPELEVTPISTTELLVRIAPQNQARFCRISTYRIPPPNTQHYKLRVFEPASACTGNYPDTQCSDNSNQCITVTTGARPSAEEVTITGLTINTPYEVEVIAGHTCDATANTIGFTIPAPNPNSYGYPSAPVTKEVTTLSSDGTAPAAPTGVSATFTAADSTVNYDRWNLSWTEVSGATGYLFTIDHDTSQPAPPDTDAKRYVYTPSTRETSFSARSPVGEFTCTKSGTTITCTVRDDDQASTSPHTNLEFKVWSVSASGISAAADTSPTPSVEQP